MKKYLCFAMLFVFLLTGCGSKGDVSGVALVIGPSQVYEEAEIRDAMHEVCNEFKKMKGACTLRELSYDEELNRKQWDGWAAQYNADEVIVLRSRLDVAKVGGPATLEPGSTHYWSWVLTRDYGGAWVLQTWGYA